MLRVLRLAFLPASADLGLLVLRVWAGTLMLVLHGWGKVVRFSQLSTTFADPFGLGSLASVLLVIAAEVVGSVLIILGLFTRPAAIAGAIGMATAFWTQHEGRLKGPGHGELPFLFLAIYVTLVLAGAGRYSLDGNGRGRRR